MHNPGLGKPYKHKSTWSHEQLITCIHYKISYASQKNVVHVTSTSQYPCQDCKTQKNLFLASRLLATLLIRYQSHVYSTQHVYSKIRTQLASLCCSLTLFCRDQARLNHEQKDMMSDSHSDGEILIEK